MVDISADEWRSLSEYLDQALDLDEPARAAWLANLRGSDAAMAELVANALAASEQAGFSEFLAGPAPLPVGESSAATLIGRTVGPYVIDAEIGRGGMGSVWRARRADGRYEGTVAIKFVHAAWIGRAGEQRFRIEGNLLGRLDHPNIARLLDAGVLEGTQPYLILEFVEGEPIDTFCERHKLNVEARVSLFLDVLAAVAHAHSHLIVHRDIKPANIFVTLEGVVKLLDFGIAKLLDDETGSSALTRTSATALTPQYAAPEQLLGQPVSTATDVYTLGLVLYVLLTGSHPIASGSRASAELVKAVLSEIPPPASTVAGIATVPGRSLEGDLDNILNKALKKEPEERYASVGAFAEDLRRFLDDEPVEARPDTMNYRVAKFVRRHRGSVLSATLFAVALIITSAFAIFQLFAARAQRDLAEFEATRASAQSELTEFLLGDSLSRAPSEVVHQRLERARTMIHRRFNNDPRLQASLLIGLSGRYIDVGDFKGSATVMREAEAIGQRVDDAHLNADIACGKAEDAAEGGDLAAARAQEAIGQANMRRLELVPPGLTAECAMATANIAQREGNYERAVATTRQAMRTLEQAGQERTSRYTSIAHDYARSLSMAGDYRGAWAAEQSVIAIAADSGRDDSAGYFAMVNVGSNSLLAGGQPLKAVGFIDATIAKSRSAAPSADLPFYLDATRLLAESAAGSPRASDAGLMQAADTAEKQGMMSAVTMYRASAVQAALSRGDLASAATAWLPLSALEAKILTNEAWRRDAKRVLIAHARMDLAHGDVDGAARRLEQATALIPVDRRLADPEWRRIAVLRAEIAYEQHDYPAAASDAEMAVERARAEAVDPQSSAWIGEALVWRGRSQLAMGDAAAAAATAKEALPHLEQNLDPQHPMIAAARSLAAGRGR
jgi:serine/threonine-protein kinase